eukprot:gnl/MRDRNA2_/MRDRNA2_128361_c0_seq1.p1 gnl/MRDRNA2_/MRDRNA2_128361_c0~~gnl/MRDRNA2_/MRDRNA2_128361_c0_seq1.p1  ORF type:complete len:755 (+),score=110.04 gnl/MRDRNA2_/MRDRNA2_128361_c0_seq1:71-2335(+)
MGAVINKQSKVSPDDYTSVTPHGASSTEPHEASASSRLSSGSNAIRRSQTNGIKRKFSSPLRSMTLGVNDDGEMEAFELKKWLAQKMRMPFVVPVHHPLDLQFFRKVFAKLLAMEKKKSMEIGDEVTQTEAEVPLAVFERAMVRLFRVLQDDQHFSAKEYDIDYSGGVGWFEFVAVWRQHNITIRMSFFERLYMTMEDPQSSVVSKIVSLIVMLLIVLSSMSFVLSTLPHFRETPAGCPSCPSVPVPGLGVLDTICVVLFTAEYLLRLASSSMMRVHLVQRDTLKELMCSNDFITAKSPLRKMVDFLFSPANMIDLAAILPYYIKLVLASSGGNDSLVMLRLIRLTRALRLGRRFEAVTIIARSMARSVRALSALIINMFLGIVIWGSLMYFAEQGVWDPDARTYTRWESASWDGEQWVDQKGNSPFVSIPGALWWALVTSTTVGYGDNGNFPTTGTGKAIAAIAIIWSLCVLALPIGVIGSNFEQVWSEFDDERAMEREMARSEDLLFSNSACLVDPLVKCRNLVIEIYHDAAEHIASDVNNIFLGKVEIKMDIDTHKSSRRSVAVSLQPDYLKSKRRVQGLISFDYSWTPDAKREKGVLVSGMLELTNLMVECLRPLDWTGKEALLNPFAVIRAYPRSPASGTHFTSKHFRTSTLQCTLDPEWVGEKAVFSFRWTKQDIDAKKEAENEAMKDNLCLAFDPEGSSKPPDKYELIATQVKAIPHVIEEIQDVKRQILELHQVLAKRSVKDAMLL